MPQWISFSWHILQYKQLSTLQWFCGYYSFVAKPVAVLCTLPLATYLQSAAAGNWSWQLKKTTTCQDFGPRFLWTLSWEWWEKGRTIFRGLLNPFGLYIIHWVAKYSVGKWLNCWGMKTCWGQHSSTAGCPRDVHARFGEGLMCIMMSTSRLTLTPIICIPYCTIKEITTAWWMVCRKGENSFPK